MHNNPPDSHFSLLINDLEALRDAREIRENARQARMATEAARNRRLHHVQRQQVKRSVLAKAAPPAPAPAPNFDRIAAQQAQLESAMRDTAARAARDRQARVKADCRAVIADLRHAAKRGELSAAAAAKLDAMIGQAARMGLRP